MRVLCIVYCYPPLLYPATMCYVKLVKGLKENGVDLEVVTVDPDTFHFPGGKSIDPTLEAIIPDGVRNHQIRSWEGNFLMRGLRGNRTTHRLLYKVFEPRKREWTFPAIRYLKKMDLSGFDAVLTCSQPHCNHLVGMELKRMTGKPWIAYFSDPWTDNVYASFHSDKVLDYNLALEREVISRADRVFFTSEEIRRPVMAKFPEQWNEKCGVLPHCFVPEWYGTAARPADDKMVRILHTGHFYGPRSPMPLFRALARVNRDTPLEGKLCFEFYGSMDGDAVRFVGENGLSAVIAVSGTIPYLRSLGEMSRADYLLLIDAPVGDGEESVFLPSKLVDYLGSGKPIIGITPTKGASARVLRETGNIVCDVRDEEAIESRVRDILAGSTVTSPDHGAADAYRCDRVSAHLAETMKELC